MTCSNVSLRCKTRLSADIVSRSLHDCHVFEVTNPPSMIPTYPLFKPPFSSPPFRCGICLRGGWVGLVWGWGYCPNVACVCGTVLVLVCFFSAEGAVLAPSVVPALPRGGITLIGVRVVVFLSDSKGGIMFEFGHAPRMGV